MKIRFCLVSLSIALCAWQSPGAIAQTGKSTVDRLVQIFSKWNGTTTDRQVYSEAAKYIDYTAMASRSLGAGEWNKLNAQQKTEFTNTLRTLIEERYYPRWHKIFNKGKVSYISENTSGHDTLVNTKLTVGHKTDPLVWRLETEGDDTKVVSLSVENEDLLRKLSGRLNGKLSKYGFNGLMSWMKNKSHLSSNDTPGEQTAVAGTPR